ncbi:MAG: radical SAM protein [Kiritimatiellia bacterium]|jgi:12,18-didecarboxysiroheme deacetylase|nr:radical SAM protein [Kiritimatiellia bacterium]
MIGISKLYLGKVEVSDPLRYGRQSARLPSHLLQFSSDKKPVVVWNVTARCNLRCTHCYAATGETPQELSTEEALGVIDDLAAFGCPVLLFSGGEPFIRPDILTLARHAAAKGLRVVFSTNGTLIDARLAAEIRGIGVSYVGISLDGMEAVHDRFRACPGAFRRSLEGIRLCRDAQVKVGLRVTLTRDNVDEIPAIFDLMEAERIPRICLYHLVYCGRGAEIAGQDLPPDVRRAALDRIIDRTARLHERGFPAEVLTVDNHCDGPYLYLRMVREKNPRAGDVMALLRMNGGNSTGHGLACISWDGTVYPDQFWRNRPVGSVRERPFSEIWGRPAPGSLLALLREKKRHVTGRCATCRFLDVCGGNFRARAEAATGELWGVDPACYLTDDEIAQGGGA